MGGNRQWQNPLPFAPLSFEVNESQISVLATSDFYFHFEAVLVMPPSRKERANFSDGWLRQASLVLIATGQRHVYLAALAYVDAGAKAFR
jgi:hypothetical protein